MPFQKYKKWDHGVINAIERSEIPLEAVFKSQNMYFKENYWRKIPGLTEIHNTQIEDEDIKGIFVFNKILPQESIRMAVAGNNLYRFDEGVATWTSVYTGLLGDRISFIENGNFLYFGSDQDLWRRYDGGDRTYSVGGNNGNASNAPRKFTKIVFNPYSGRFFAIGDPLNPDYLYWSEDLDNGGFEIWPAGNIQIIESVSGDTPKDIQIFEGRITIFSENSVNSGSVVGVPETWSFQREKAQSGGVAGKAIKRHGNRFFMFTPDNEVYTWPDDKFITKGRVKFSVDKNFNHLAVAEIVDDRYYVLCFKSGEAVPSNKYHWWVYDILGDRWYGPSIQRNIITMHYDTKSAVLLCGGTDDLKGFVFEYRGKDIKNLAMKCELDGSYSDFGFPRIEKRFIRGWIKTKQEGNLPGGEGQVELIINTDNRFDNAHSQRIVLSDPSNDNVSDTGSVKEAVTKHFYIHDAFGRGNALNWLLKHEVQAGDISFSELEIEFDLLNYRKADRGVG